MPRAEDVGAVDCAVCPPDDEDAKNIPISEAVNHFRLFHPDLLDDIKDKLAARRAGS